MNIQIKSRLSAEVLFEHDCENNSIRLTLELAIKSRADLSGACLSSADLSSADLRDACLSSADLSSAYLSGAYLKNKEKLVGKRPILQIGPIGSRHAYFVAYITDKGLRFDAGCQRQITREVFESRLTELHGENEHAKEYRAVLALIDAHAEIWAPKEDPSATEVKASAEAG